VTLERLSASLADRYRLERELGQGGMATVYLAQDLKHDRKVALKVLRPELAAVIGAERFVVEIKTTAALQHPHILPLFDSGTADGFLYYVMPFIDGETLRARLNRETQLGIDEAVKITVAVADALDYAHRQGVIHRDIKPENILLHDGRPMVADFGIALALSAAAGGRMTETGLSLGTPHYMSPEQATAAKEISARSDVYSLGSVLYEMLTGNPPHVGASAQQIIMKIVTEEAPPVTKLRKSVPPNVADAVAKSLEKLPADRFESARAFAGALANSWFRTATSPGASLPTALPAFRPTALLAVTTVAALALAAWGWLRPEPPRPVARTGLAIPADRAPVIRDQTQLALAPDGSWLVYTGPGSSPGETQLWVKARDQLDATPLAGTVGAGIPSVSPDGKWTGFIAGGRLWKIPASGGVATTIADSAQGTAIWLDDGAVAYADGGWRLRRIPAAGGIPEVLFTPEAGRFASPKAALPNGRGILFTNCSASCTPTSELWVADGRSGETRLLLPDVAWAAYADGRLLFTRRDGAVFGAPFDLGTLSLKGAPVPLLDGVTVTNGAHITLSASGTMAYVAGGRSSLLSEAVWVSRDGRATPVDTAWGFRLDDNLPSWDLSPDGQSLAINLRIETNADIWVKELDRGPVSRLTFDAAQDMRPRWTPDGRAVTFLSNRAGDMDLYQRRADGTGTDSLVLDLKAPIWEALWSRDRQWIVMRTGTNDNGRDIVALRVGQDTVPRPLLTAPYDEEAPALSPDGRWLAYVSNETGRREVVVRPFPGVESGKWQVSTAGGISPVWARSGRELFFINSGRQLVSQALLPGAAFQRGDQKVLFSVAGYRAMINFRSFDVGPDDRRFLMVRWKAGGAAVAPVLVVVENWLEEVDRIMRGGSR
jgi:tRNA A-37 threonylcarbamoyl transferase component Bud32